MRNEHLKNVLLLKRCPHCGVDTPHFPSLHEFETAQFDGGNARNWKAYKCSRCGGAILAATEKGYGKDGPVTEMYPDNAGFSHDSIPERAQAYLNQASDSIHAPAGSVVLSAAAVDAMLKAKGYKDGSLYSRINKAADDHLITKEMAEWAHDVRLDANDQRHSDDTAPLPVSEDAKRSIRFARALAQFLFVLPATVRRGIEESKPKKS